MKLISVREILCFSSNFFFSVFGLGEEWPANWNHSRLCDFHAERKFCWGERARVCFVLLVVLSEGAKYKETEGGPLLF